MKQKISVIMRVGISAGLLAFLLWSARGKFHDILSTLKKTDLLLFSLAAFLFILNVWILSARLKLLLTGEGLEIPFKRVVELSFVGYFFNNFLPTAVGGDIVKAYYVSKQTEKSGKSFIAIFMDRFIGLFTFILLAIAAVLFSWEGVDPGLRKGVFGLGLVAVLIVLTILNTAFAKMFLGIFSKLRLWNLGERLSRIYMAVHDYRNKKALIVTTMAASITAQCVYFSIMYFLIKSLGAGIFLKTVFLIMPIVSVASMLPSIGGLGLREGAIVALFGPVIGVDNGFAAGILLLATMLIISLIGAVIYIAAPQFRIKAKDLAALDNYGA